MLFGCSPSLELYDSNSNECLSVKSLYNDLAVSYVIRM